MRSRPRHPQSRLLLLLLTLLPAAAIPALAAQEHATAPQRAIAITIDDLPFQGQQPDPDSLLAANRELVAKLTAHRVPAIGFVNEEKLHRGSGGALDPRRVAALELWLDAGLDLGNHGYAHLDLHRVPLADYQAEVLRGERVTRELLAARGRKPRYFRHPFLRTGRDLETRDAFHAFLVEHGYRVAPVTVDNSEWIFAGAYARAVADGDRELAARIGAEYVPYMERKVEWYESRARALFGREITQTLLIHVNLLNAATFDELAAMLRARGYRFVSLAEALEDEAYRSSDTWTGAGGISWLDRWALAAGKKGDFFRDEPRTPQWVLDAAGVESE
ncbi:MAG TPA: polysaccharide deacetylase family protein [Thermoanaerobaculia bacterium]|nr:polysaccharide deacetylase family protein [Thermoanaerobaculia bacterium]